MTRFAILATALVAAVASVSASPVATNGTTLEKRTTHTGRGTWYDTGLGACGYTDANTDYIVAISHDIYDSGNHCNRYLRIKNTATGVTAYGKARDECMGCEATAIDLSPSLFEALGADLGEGVITVAWNFMGAGWSPSS
ncbi:RlpA-like double-psi beta-barrel-protein domain-containing protein-containing protein [Fomitopsis betulina]|nr:RlpA-like double-psi beta-barrel-protein domain-containing protein-containing protein [Fomitopsis betulina]